MLRGRGFNGAILAAVAVAVVVGAFGGVALAGHLSSDVQSVTGCLSARGDLGKFKEGDTPAKPCTGNEVQVHLSGGDITSILAGTGLAGSAENGAATLSIDPSYALPQNCAQGESIAWNNGTWICSSPAPLP